MRALALVALLAALAGCAQFNQIVKSTKAQVTLVEGLRQFDAGNHGASAKSLASALEMGLGPKDRAVAHKHLAFIHCASGRERQCRDEFRKALSVEPGLELAPAEAGHPTWGPIFRSLKAGR